MDASGGVEAGLEQAVALGRSTGHGGVLLHQQVRPRERRPDRRARRAARRVRQQDRAAPARHRRGRVVQRLRRPRPSQGVAAGTARRRSRSRSRTSWPTRSRRAATSCSRPPPRPTTTSWPSTSRARRSPTPSSRPACARASRKRSWRPCWSAARRRGSGCAALLDAIVRYLPSPADEPPVKADRQGRRDGRGRRRRDGPLLVRVFKTTADPFVGRLTYLRVLSGTLHSQAHVWNATRGEDERIGQLLLLHGKEQEPIGELKAGEIGAVAKLGRDRDRRHAVARRRSRSRCRRSSSPSPSLMVAIEPQTKGDLDKMGPALQRMLEEEPTVRARADARSASRSCARWARPTSRSSSSDSSASSGPRS